MKRRQEQFHRASAIIGRELSRDAIQLAAITGLVLFKHQRFFKNSARAQLFRGFASLFRAESHAFAQRNRGCAG